MQKGLVEIITNNKGNSRYILASYINETAKGRHKKWAYFICATCQHTEIIAEPINIRTELLTENYIIKCSLILEGICGKGK